MPTATSSVEVCNLSLDLLRQTDKVTDIALPESETEVICARWYDVTRRSVLRAFPWNFARKRITLARNAVAPDFGYADAYDLPVNYLALVFVGDDYDEDYETDYAIEDNQILINNDGAASLNICYVQDKTEVTRFDALFLDLLTAEFAIRLSNALTGNNKGMKEIISWRNDLRLQARSKNGQDNPVKVRDVSRIQARRKLATSGGSFDGTHVPL